MIEITEAEIRSEWDEIDRLFMGDNAAWPPPDGAKTAAELGARYGMTGDNATRRLRPLVESGVMCTGSYKEPGSRYWKNYYWLASGNNDQSRDVTNPPAGDQEVLQGGVPEGAVRVPAGNRRGGSARR